MYRSIRDWRPHPWLLATTRRRRSCQWVTVVSGTFTTPWESVGRATLVGNSSIIRLTITTNEIKFYIWKHFMISRVIYLWKSFDTNTFLSMIIYLRIPIHEHFQVWFLIGKNYILQRKRQDFSTITNAYELTNIIVDFLKHMHLR